MFKNSLELPFPDIAGLSVMDYRPLEGGCLGSVFWLQAHVTEAFSGYGDLFTSEQRESLDKPSALTHCVELVIKTYPASKKTEQNALLTEAAMLRYLKQHSQLPVPTVLDVTPEWLLMTYLPGTSPTRSQHDAKSIQADLAQHLARLHRVEQPYCGLAIEGRAYDTLIGGLKQPNPLTTRWLDFYREQRVFHMALAAYHEGVCPLDMLKKLEKCCDHIDRWLIEPTAPALLHGDIWTNNILAEKGQITGILDPAIYYGHPEIELAFGALFGPFDAAFYDAYQDYRSIDDGFFEIRQRLYHLYPLLVHTRLFGEHYLADVQAILKRIGL